MIRTRPVNRACERIFVQDCYMQSGWIPVSPLGTTITIGDVFQIVNGQTLALLNIVDLELTRPPTYSESVVLRQSDWPSQCECEQTLNSVFSEQDESGTSQYRQQHYRFHQAGGYLFSGRGSKGTFLLDWHKLAEELIVKLTQSKFTFQEIYVVTAVAETPLWGLAIAEQADAELKLMAQTTEGNCLFSLENCEMNESRSLAFYGHSKDSPLVFFKAKKLVLSSQKQDQYLSEILSGQGAIPLSYQNSWLQTRLLNLATSNELNISTCMEYFSWQDATLDDVVKLTS